MDITLSFEWISFSLSLLLLHPANLRAARLLILILGITVVAECTGYVYRVVLHRPSNHEIYNISVPAIIILLTILLKRQTKNKSNHLTINLLLLSYCIFLTINLLWIQGRGRFATYNYIAGTVILVLTVTLYFLELIKKKEYVFISGEPLFWVAAAILLLYIPKAVLYAIFEFLAYKKSVMQSFGDTFRLLNRILSVIFFSLLSYASICRLIFRK